MKKINSIEMAVMVTVAASLIAWAIEELFDGKFERGSRDESGGAFINSATVVPTKAPLNVQLIA